MKMIALHIKNLLMLKKKKKKSIEIVSCVCGFLILQCHQIKDHMLDCCAVCYGQPALEKGKDMVNTKKCE